MKDSDPKPEEAYLLEGFPFGKYELIAYENEKFINETVTIEFKREQNTAGEYTINGRSQINFYFGSFSLNGWGKTITISSLASTKIGGDAEKLEQEQEFLERLQRASTFEVGSQDQTLKLYLNEQNSEYLVFELTN